MEKNLTREKPELLCPAKDLEVLKTAVDFGADAVYIGGEAYGLNLRMRMARGCMSQRIFWRIMQILQVQRRTSASSRSCVLMRF